MPFLYHGSHLEFHGTKTRKKIGTLFFSYVYIIY